MVNILIPLMQGTNIGWENIFFAQLTLPKTNSILRSVQTKEWKYVHDFADPTKNEFYNLVEDPFEAHNIIDNPDPKIISGIEQMREMLISKLIDINDPVLH